MNKEFKGDWRVDMLNGPISNAIHFLQSVNEAQGDVRLEFDGENRFTMHKHKVDVVRDWLNANVWDGDKISGIDGSGANRAHHTPKDLEDLIMDLLDSMEDEDD